MYGQSTKGIPIATSLDRLIVNQWSVRDGLVTNKINDIIQSMDGYLWITTYDGIIRFDGHKFDKYNKNNVEAIEVDTYYEMLQRSDSVLLFLSRGKGLVQYKNGQFQKYEHNDIIPGSVRTIFVDSKDRLWIGSFDYVYVEHEGQIVKLDNKWLNNGSVLEITEDSEGNIYFATDGNGVIQYNGEDYKQYTTEDGLADDIIISIAPGKNGRIVAGTFKGISVIQQDEVRSITFTAGARVNDIFVDDYNNILLGTDLGLYRVNERDSIYEKIIEGNKLPTREINSLEIDHENNIWLGMEKGGLIRLKEGKFENITENDGLTLNRTNIVVQRYANEYWAGSDNGDIDIIDWEENTIVGFKPKTAIDNKGIRDFLFDSNGNIWIASYSGLLKISGSNEMMYSEQTGLSSSLVRRVIEDSKGNIWVGTRSGGINKISQEGTIEVFDKSRGLLTNYILDLIEYDNGQIYAATNRGGVSLIDQQGNITNFTDFGGAVDLVNFNFSKDNKGRLWLTNSNGLFYLDQGKFKKIEINSNLHTEAIFDLVDDGQGSYWLTTNIGLVEISEAQVEKYISGAIKEVDFKHYDDRDGMTSRECTAATRSILASDGKVWIPTLSGVSIMDPSRIIINNRIPQVHITEFSVDEVQYNIDEPIVLAPDHIRCKIGFTALSYKAPDNILFKYKLEGVDQDWIQSGGEQREIQYTNIPYGNYTFKVIATNNDGIWNEKGASISFEVEPYIYETKWFYVISTIFIVVGFISISRWREQKINKRNIELKKLNAELDSFVYSTSHDLRAPLASVLGLINIARIDNNAKEKDNYMDLMEASIKKLDDFIQDIIDYSRNSRTEVKYEAFNIKNVIVETIEGLKYLDPEDQIKSKIEIIGDGIVSCDKQRLKIIFNNLISNVLKYYDHTKENPFMRIKVDLENNFEIKILVEDNGIGIEQNELDKVFGMFYRGTERSKGSGIGLYIVKETVDKLKGNIQVKSQLAEGSSFEIIIPKR